jgi:hypothetical protein
MAKILSKEELEGTPNNWKELSERTLISEDLLQDFDRWARHPPAYNEHWRWVRTLQWFFTVGFRSPIVQESFDMGGFEGISNILRVLIADAKNGGIASVEERTKMVDILTNNVTSLLINFGVVGALIVSVVFPLALVPMQLSESSTEFFGNTLTYVFWIAHQILAIVVIVLSVIIIFCSIVYYKLLSFWMFDDESRLWFVQSISVVPIVVFATTLLMCVPAVLVTGVAAFVSPVAALISLIGTLVFFLLALFINAVETKSWLYLHMRANQFVLRDKEKMFASSTVHSTSASVLAYSGSPREPTNEGASSRHGQDF